MANRTASHNLFVRACKVIPGGVNSPVRAFRSVGGEPFFVDRGEGAYLIDADGNRYVDFVCSWGPLVLGHADPGVVAALHTQAQRGTSFGACHALEAELAEKVQQLFPSIELLRFVNSGTEAGMSVIRLARAYTKRSKILKFSGCYHGHVDTLLVQAGSGVATLGLPDSPGVLPSVAHDTITVEFNDLDGLRAAFAAVGTEIAAVITEPVVGNAGFIPPRPGFLQELRRICSEYGVLLIFDEVMTGFRVALGGAQSLYSITPDLTMLGKVIGGGLPVGAFGGRREIMQLIAPLGPVYQAGTLSGNPLAMAAGIATLDQWSAAGVFEAVSGLAQQFVSTLKQAAEERGIPFTAGCAGTMFGFFFADGPIYSYSDAKRSDVARFRKFFTELLAEGVYIAPSQFEAGFLSRAHAGEPIEKACEAVRRAMKTV